MMSPDNLTVINPPSANGDETALPGSAVSGARRTAPTGARPLEPPPPQKCPRCDSPNTKFCYYNNYSLTQPRHFCKTCRRYWTKGGALRNVPIGGGCRKNKKVSTKSSSSRLSSSDSKDLAGSSSYSDIGGFKFFSNLSPAMDFQLGGLNSNFTRFQSPGSGANNNFIHHHQNYPVSFGDISTPVATLNSGFALDPNATNAGSYLMGFNYPGLKPDHGNASGFSSGLMQEFGGTTTSTNNNRNNLASIESLSSMNQDLHWKLQQERLAVLFGGGTDININNNNNINVNNNNINNNGHVQKPQPILFENLEINSSKSAGDYQHHVVGGGGAVESRKDATTNGSDHGGCIGSLATEWYFDKFSSFAPAVNPTPTTSSSTGNGIQGWNGNFDQYPALP